MMDKFFKKLTWGFIVILVLGVMVMGYIAHTRQPTQQGDDEYYRVDYVFSTGFIGVSLTDPFERDFINIEFAFEAQVVACHMYRDTLEGETRQFYSCSFLNGGDYINIYRGQYYWKDELISVFFVKKSELKLPNVIYER